MSILTRVDYRGEDASEEMPGADISPLQSYAAWYAQQQQQQSPEQVAPSALLTADYFKRLSRSAQRSKEAELWSLIEELLREAEESTHYHPEAICGGIARIAPQRRWFVSQFALLQHLLQRHPTLRRMNVICCWLESAQREGLAAPARLVGQEDGMLRHSIFTFLRAGQLHRAIDAATTYGDADYSCLLRAAQLQSVRESWFAQTGLVRLFGEYGHSELPQQAWCGNEHRLHNLALLYTRSIQGELTNRPALQDNTTSETSARSSCAAQQSIDTVIAAALCGNLAVLEPAFLLSGSWADVMWCYLRCTLVLAFTKALVSAHTDTQDVNSSSDDGAYVSYVTQMTGTDEDWPERFARRMVTALTLRMQQSYLSRVSLVEQLQMRIILQFLSVEGAGDEWLSDIVADVRSAEAVRLVTHTLLVLDAAYRETLLRHSVQLRAGATLMRHLVGYARAMVHLASSSSSLLNDTNSGNAMQEGLRLLIPLVQRVRHGPYRANVYAAYVLAAREWELLRGVLDRAALEEQEASLVRLYVAAERQRRERRDSDTSNSYDGEAGEVEREVQEQLMQATRAQRRTTVLSNAASPAHGTLTTTSAGIPDGSSSDAVDDDYNMKGVACSTSEGKWPAGAVKLLTDNATAERVLWAAMHASSPADYHAVLCQGLEACVTFWTAQPEPLFAALHDVSGILTRRVLPELISHTGTSPAVTMWEQNEVRFWYAFRELRRLAEEHARIAGALSAAQSGALCHGPTPEKTLLYQLIEDEAALMQRLREHAISAVRSGGAVVQRARACLTAVFYLVQLFVDEATVSVLCGSEASLLDAGQEPLLQVVMGLLEELDGSGYLHPRLLPQECAAELFVHIRSLRVAYGQRMHEQRVRQAIQSAARATELTCDAAA